MTKPGWDSIGTWLTTLLKLELSAKIPWQKTLLGLVCVDLFILEPPWQRRSSRVQEQRLMRLRRGGGADALCGLFYQRRDSAGLPVHNRIARAVHEPGVVA